MAAELSSLQAHLEQPLVSFRHPPLPPLAPSAPYHRRLLLCPLLLRNCPQQLVVKVGNLGPLKQQVLDDSFEQRGALARRRLYRQRYGQGGVLHLGTRPPRPLPPSAL